MQSAVKFIQKENKPFHSPGTLIFQAKDGTLMRNCPLCGEGKVPSRYVRELEKYVGKRIK